MVAAATMRETYLILSLPMLVHASRDRGTRQFLVGAVTVGVAFLLFVAYDNSLAMYLKDVFHGGVAFRTNDAGVISKIRTNISTLSPFMSGLSWIIVISAILFFAVSNKGNSRPLYAWLMAGIVIMEFLVNNAASYSMVPIVAFISVIFIIGLQNILDNISMRDIFERGGLVVVLIAASIIPIIHNQAESYSGYSGVARLNKRGALEDSIPYRSLKIINSLPHRTISAHSQYPLLFMSRVRYSSKYPYLEDTSGAANMRPDLAKEYMKKFKNEPPDVYYSKTTDSFLSKWTDFGKILADEYIEVARFASPKHYSVVYPYKESMHYSKRSFLEYFEKVDQSVEKLAEPGVWQHLKVVNTRDSGLMIEIDLTQALLCDATIAYGHSLVSFDPERYSNKIIYGYIPPNSAAHVRFTGLCASNPPIRYYKAVKFDYDSW